MLQVGATRFVCLGVRYTDIVRVRLLDHTDNLEDFVDEADSVYNYISGIIVEEE